MQLEQRPVQLLVLQVGELGQQEQQQLVRQQARQVLQQVLEPKRLRYLQSQQVRHRLQLSGQLQRQSL
jgi:predicted nuclease of predicted toxin-antitoxin system